MALSVFNTSSDSSKFEILDIPTDCDAKRIDLIEILLSELT